MKIIAVCGIGALSFYAGHKWRFTHVRASGDRRGQALREKLVCYATVTTSIDGHNNPTRTSVQRLHSAPPGTAVGQDRLFPPSS